MFSSLVIIMAIAEQYVYLCGVPVPGIQGVPGKLLLLVRKL